MPTLASESCKFGTIICHCVIMIHRFCTLLYNLYSVKLAKVNTQKIQSVIYAATICSDQLWYVRILFMLQQYMECVNNTFIFNTSVFHIGYFDFCPIRWLAIFAPLVALTD